MMQCFLNIMQIFPSLVRCHFCNLTCMRIVVLLILVVVTKKFKIWVIFALVSPSYGEDSSNSECVSMILIL